MLKRCLLRTTRATDIYFGKHTIHNVLFDNKAINFWYLTTSTNNLEKNVYKRRNIYYSIGTYVYIKPPIVSD